MSQIYDLWKKENIKQSSSDAYSAKIFVPMAAQHGYNCIIEHESEDSSMFNSNEYILFSKELLAGNCCKFIDYKKIKALEKTLSSIDIYDDKSINILKSL